MKTAAKESEEPMEEEKSLINFDEEIARFKPSLEVGDMEDAIGKCDLTDMTDIMIEMMKAAKED